MSDIAMLAATWRPEKAKYPLWIEPKLDGYRFLMVFGADGSVKMLQGRSGADYTAKLGWMAEQLQPTVQMLYPKGVTLDGEVAAGGGWGETSSLVRTDGDIDRSQLMFYAFDLIDGFVRPLVDRKSDLELLIEQAGKSVPNVSMVLHFVVHCREEVDVLFAKFLECGFEGGMLKDPNGIYVKKRSRAWEKYKPWVSTEGRVTGFQEGLNRLEGTLGALVLDSGGTGVSLGSGLTDALRHEIWANRELYLGRIVEFKYQKDPQKVAEFRFPIFLRFREDMED